MVKQPFANRWWICVLVGLASISLLFLTLTLPTQAKPQSGPPPVWRSFPLAHLNGSYNINVFDHYILWSDFDAAPAGPASCEQPLAAGIPDNLEARSETSSLAYGDFFDFQKIFQQTFLPPIDHDICIYDTHTGLVDYLIPNDGFEDSWPRMYGDWVVFQRWGGSGYTLILYNIVTSEQRVITDWTQEAQRPAVYDNLVVYDNHHPGNYYMRISAYQISNGEYITISMAPRPFYLQGYPDIYDQTVVWLRSVTNSPIDWELVGYDLTSQTPFTISARPGNEGIPHIDGDLVVWHWEDDIYGYNISTGEYLTITNDPYRQIFPDVYQNLVVWSDDRHGRWDVYARDLETGETFWITEDNPLPQSYFPSVWGNLVAWDSNLDGAAAARKMTEFGFLPILR
jgi:beta propeller repeat protein